MHVSRTKRALWFLVVGVIAVGGGSRAWADAIVLQPGPEGIDAGLYGHTPDANAGSAAIVGFGSFADTNNWRPIVQFDLSAVPTGFPLTQAILTMTEHEDSGSHHQYRAHAMRITEPWVESEVTWNNRTAADLWSTPGGSVAEDWASVEFTTQQGYQPLAFDVTALVQGWLAGTYPNYGVLFQPETLYIDPPGSPLNNYTSFLTSDYAEAAYRPMLTLIPEPAAFWLALLAGLMRTRRR